MTTLTLRDSGFLGSNVSDPNFANVKVLLHCNGSNGSSTFIDSSSNNLTVTRTGAAQVSTVESYLGGASAYFNGASDSLTFADPALGTDNFTIEMWVKTASTVQYAQLIGNEGSGGFTFLINNNSAGGGQLAVYAPGLVVSSSAGDWSDNAWHHFALTRSSGANLTLWVDGNSVGTGTSSANFSGSATMYVGRNNVYTPRNMIGYIDEIRITKGIARYNGTFTPPAAPFPDF